MRDRNDGTGKDNILFNQFTAYLVTALHRRRIYYFRSQKRIWQNEVAVDLQEGMPNIQYELDFWHNMSLFDQIENVKLVRFLREENQRSIYILLERALEDRSIAEIARELEMPYTTVASIYTRLIAKIKRDLEAEE